MWVGTYGLDLYCDNATDLRELVDEHGHNHGEFPHQYTGESGSNCRTRARRAGWIIGRDGSAICPKCSGKRKPSNSKIQGRS